MPGLATRCLCVLSLWLVCLLVPCAPMSIVCPLTSCYLIIISVAPPVSPSFVSLFSLPVSAVLCLSIVFRVSLIECVMFDQSSACLLVFSPSGWFLFFCLILLLKTLIPLHLSPRPHLSLNKGERPWCSSLFIG